MAKIGTLLRCKLHLEREIYLSFEICLVLCFSSIHYMRRRKWEKDQKSCLHIF